MHTVKSCCCGCSLKTGTLIILSLGVVGGLLRFFQGIAASSQENIGVSTILTSSLGGVIGLCISIAGIYGVNKRKPSFLIPHLVVQVLGMAYLLIMMLVVAFVGTEVLSISPKQSSELSSQDVVGGIVFVEIVSLICEGIIYYLFVVVLSYYKELKAELPV